MCPVTYNLPWRVRIRAYDVRSAFVRECFSSFTFFMAAFECRLCKAFVPRHRAIDLFGPKAVKERLSFRITGLLDVPVRVSDGLSRHICEKCKRKLDRLEKAAEELEDFRRQAARTYTQLGLSRGELKRTKETSSAVGVSPDTEKSRPPSKKLSRRRLDFEQGKCMYNNIENQINK